MVKGLVRDSLKESLCLYKCFRVDLLERFIFFNRFGLFNLDKVILEVKLKRLSDKYIVLKKIKKVLAILELIGGNTPTLNIIYMKKQKVLNCSITLRKTKCIAFCFLLGSLIHQQQKELQVKKFFESKKFFNIIFGTGFIDILVLNFIIFDELSKYFNLKFDELISFKIRLFFTKNITTKYQKFFLKFFKII